MLKNLGFALDGWLRSLESRPVHQKTYRFHFGQGTYLGCKQYPALAQVGGN